MELEEPAESACAALIYFLGSERNPEKARAIALDLRYRAEDLGRSQRSRVDEFIGVILSNGPDPEAAATLLAAPEFRREKTERVDLAIFAVQEIEWQALREVFRFNEDDFRTYQRRRRYWRTTVRSKQSNRTLTAIVSVIGKDQNINVAPVLSDFWRSYEADSYCLIGMAAGLRDRVSLGDIVSPEVVFYYEHGRATPEGPQPRYEQAPLPEEIRSNLFFLDLKATAFQEELREIVKAAPQSLRPKGLGRNWRPEFHKRNAYIASGEKVIADGSLMDMNASYDERTIAADEESYGFANSLTKRTWCVFRGIADYGDPLKESGWQYISTCAAALAAKHFFIEQYIPPTEEHF